MIDQDTARSGAALIASAIAQTFEDHADAAARFTAATDPHAVATSLHAAADDVLTLAAALLVFTRSAAEG